MHRMFKRLIANSLIIKKVTHSKYYSNASFLNSILDISNAPTTGVERQDKELKVGRKNAQKNLIEMLDIKAIKALEIVTTHKKFCKTPFPLMSKNYDVCTFNKLSKDVVLKYPYILIENDLSEKIEMLKMLTVKIIDSIPLVQLSLQNVNNISLRHTEVTTRIYDLCTIFNITPSVSCEILATKYFLFAMNLNHLEGLTNLLMENGIFKEDVLKDMWIFRYSEPYISNRLKRIKAHRVKTVKPWMIRCPEETLYKHIKRESDDRDILGENSVAEYLSERLKCSESMAKYLIRKHPALQTKSLLKMNEMIDFLYKHGFTSNQICRNPKILLHSTITTKKRIKEISALGNKPESLYVLTKSQKQYIQYIETSIKVKTKAKTV